MGLKRAKKLKVGQLTWYRKGETPVRIKGLTRFYAVEKTETGLGISDQNTLSRGRNSKEWL